MTDQFIDGWSSRMALKYEERQERWLLGEVVRHATVVREYPARHVRDDAAIATREPLLREMDERSARPAKVLHLVRR